MARFYPTTEQQNILNRTFGACCFLSNHFLAERAVLADE
ncbi:MAG TPA: helix-turn-helix domain-containing protein [Tissierellia bacterium]|nr:helix-turn-helix domain-containing protein [Tissierellia bacterium]